MLLPPDLLKDVHFYHVNSVPVKIGIGLVDIVTLYSRHWWKRRKVFHFNRIQEIDPETGITTLYPSIEMTEMLEQIREYLFKDIIEERNRNKVTVSTDDDSNVIFLNHPSKKTPHSDSPTEDDYDET